MDETGFEASVAARLQDLVIESPGVTPFLQELSVVAAEASVAGGVNEALCAVTLTRRRRAATIAGSTPQAKIFAEMQSGLGRGPCVAAMESRRTVVVHDTRTDARWPEECVPIAEAGYRSLLAIPLSLDEGATAVLSIFAPETGVFGQGAARNCELFARQAERALRLAVRIAVKQQLAEDLRSAMESRAAIDVASGIIMAQNHCTRAEAFEILRATSNHRNRKLHDVAEDVVRSISGTLQPGDFDG